MTNEPQPTTAEETEGSPPRKLDLGEALTFVAQEDNWIAKLIIVLALSSTSAAFTLGPAVTAALPLLPVEVLREVYIILERDPGDALFAYTPAYLALVPIFLLGVLLGALLLGYYIEVVRRVRYDADEKLPAWENWGALASDGLKMVGAYIGYLLTTFALLTLMRLILIGLIQLNQGLFAMVALICFFLPVTLAYGILVIFLTSICVVPFSESRQLADFFNLNWVWRHLNRYGRLTINWFSLGVAANMGFSAVQSLPVVGVLGSVLSLAMSSPVQGHLLGQYAAILDEREAERLAYEQGKLDSNPQVDDS